MHNFLSAAAGLAIAIALVRGFARQSVKTIGNFWVDLTRGTLYILLPISIVAALVLCSQGVIQNLHPYTVATTLEGAKQTIAQGPVASQEAIKMLGTNGGGFFNANSAHPFENPTPLHQPVPDVPDLPDPGGSDLHVRQDGARYAAGLGAVRRHDGALVRGRVDGLPLRAERHADAGEGRHRAWPRTDTQPGGNMEGKETRFGIANSALFATVTTDASCGAVNAMHDSFTPLGGLVPLFNIQLGEVVFGGVGAGLYGMLMFAILAVFIAGLMVGRTPEYLGKKIEQKEVKMAMIAHAGAGGQHPALRRRQVRWFRSRRALLEPAGTGRREHQQSRRARPVGDPLRVHQRHGQQRQRVRRHQREHSLVQPDASASRC